MNGRPRGAGTWRPGWERSAWGTGGLRGWRENPLAFMGVCLPGMGVSGEHVAVCAAGGNGPAGGRRGAAAGWLPADTLAPNVQWLALALHGDGILSPGGTRPTKNPLVRLGRKGSLGPSWFHPGFARGRRGGRMPAAARTRAHWRPITVAIRGVLLPATVCTVRGWGPGSRGVFAFALAGGGSQPVTACRCRCVEATRPARRLVMFAGHVLCVQDTTWWEHAATGGRGIGRVIQRLRLAGAAGG
jgi:hypothetical protein